MNQYPSISLACGINLYSMNFKGQNFSNMASQLLSLALLPASLILFLVMIYVIKKGSSLKKDTQEYREYQLKFGILRIGLKTQPSNWVANYWNTIIIGRWTITNMIMILSRDLPFFQIQLLLGISIFTQMLLITGKPFEKARNNIF